MRHLGLRQRRRRRRRVHHLHLGDDGTVEAIVRHVWKVVARISSRIRRTMQTLLNLQVADILRWAGVSALVCGSRKALELVPRVEDVVADEEVEDQRPNYTDPNKKVVGVYSDFVPGVVDPAPDLHLR